MLLKLTHCRLSFAFPELGQMTLLLGCDRIAIGLEAATCGPVSDCNPYALVVLAFFFRLWTKPAKEHRFVWFGLRVPIGNVTHVFKRAI